MCGQAQVLMLSWQAFCQWSDGISTLTYLFTSGSTPTLGDRKHAFSLHPTHMLPTERVILEGLCSVHPMTTIHTSVFLTKAVGSSIISPGFYRDLILQGQEQAGIAVTHMFIITRICIATNKRYILPKCAQWRWLGKSVLS